MPEPGLATNRRTFAAGSLAALASTALPACLPSDALFDNAVPELAKQLDAALSLLASVVQRHANKRPAEHYRER